MIFHDFWKLSEKMIFRDFWKLTKFNDLTMTNAGRPPQMVRCVFPARVSERFEMFEQYFQHFPGFGGRYGAESSRPLGVTKIMKMLKIDENHGFSRFSMIS